MIQPFPPEASSAGSPPAGPPIRVAFVVRDPRVRESETLAEFIHAPGSVIPSVDCSVVIGGLTWRVAHVRYFVEAACVEVWLVPFHSRTGSEPG